METSRVTSPTSAPSPAKHHPHRAKAKPCCSHPSHSPHGTSPQWCQVGIPKTRTLSTLTTCSSSTSTLLTPWTTRSSLGPWKPLREDSPPWWKIFTTSVVCSPLTSCAASLLDLRSTHHHSPHWSHHWSHGSHIPHTNLSHHLVPSVVHGITIMAHEYPTVVIHIHHWAIVLCIEVAIALLSPLFLTSPIALKTWPHPPHDSLCCNVFHWLILELSECMSSPDSNQRLKCFTLEVFCLNASSQTPSTGEIVTCTVWRGAPTTSW